MFSLNFGLVLLREKEKLQNYVLVIGVIFLSLDILG